MAHKKGQGSVKNGRDSNAQRRGVKVFGGQAVTAGAIIVRQCGSHFRPGKNAALGKDWTVYALKDGIVAFDRRKRVHILPQILPASIGLKAPAANGAASPSS